MDDKNGQIIGLGTAQWSGDAPSVTAVNFDCVPMTARRRVRRRICCIKLIALPFVFALACTTPPSFGEVSHQARANRLLDLLPPTWTDDGGRLLSLPDLRGRTVIITMAYTNCRRTCSTTMLRLQEIQRILDVKGKSAEFVIVSYDPENDDAAAWTQFRKNRNLTRPNWHFLSGRKSDTRRIANLLGLDFWAYDSHILHDFNIVVLNAEGAYDRQIGFEPVDLTRYF
jgi:cytochrome oxidase Cu insertion factor (SCO1/SenC/PrrC family)